MTTPTVMVRFQLWLARWRWAVLLVMALFVVAAVALGRKLTINEDYTTMLPLGNREIAEQVEALRHLRQADRLYIDIHTTASDEARLTEAADAFHQALRDRPELQDIRYIVDATAMQETFAQVQAHLPFLLSSNDLAALVERLEEPAVTRRLEWLKKSMSQPQGLALKDVIQTDPAGLSDAVSLRLRALQSGVGEARLVGGRITSPDGRHILLSATPSFGPSELGQSAHLLEGLLRSARQIESRFPTGLVRIALTGAHRVALDNATMIRRDTTVTSVIAALGVAALMFATYRRRWLALLGFLPTAFGALGALLVFCLTGESVSAVALGCGSILIGITVDYGIYVLYHADDAPPVDRRNLAEMVAHLAPSLAFGALTSMAAFLVMMLSPVAGHRQLGLFGLAGVVTAAVCALVLLPLVLPVGQRTHAPPLGLTAFLAALFRWRREHARTTAVCLVVLSVLSLLGLARLRFSGDLARLNGVTPATRLDEETVREVWGKALSLTTIVVGGATWDEALRKNEQVYQVLKGLQEAKAVEAFSSIAPLCPSQHTQADHGRAWQNFWTETRRQDLSRTLAAAAARLGFRPAAFVAFLDGLGKPVAPHPAQQWSDSPLGRLLSDYWQEQDGRIFISTLVKAADYPAFLRLRAAVLAASPDAGLLNKAALSEQITQLARRGLPVFAGLVACLNAGLLLILLGRLELVAITLLPMAVGIVWTLGALGLLGLPIDMSNFIFVVFVVGVGGDYSLFLVAAELDPWRGHASRSAATGGAVTVCALTTLLGVGVLVLAQHPALRSVGLTALLGISLSLLATLLLVPPCLAWLETRERKLALEPGSGGLPSGGALRRSVARLYRYQQPYVAQFVYWKMKIDPLFGAVQAALPATGEILDLGCGYGILAHWLTLAASGRKARGLDNDARKIRVAQATARANSRVSFESQDLLALDSYPACDQVLLCDVLHYFPADFKALVLQRAFAAVRPGGCLLVRDAARAETLAHQVVAWAERWAVWIGANRTRHGLHFATAQDYERLLCQAGFTRIETRQGAGLGSNFLVLAWKP
jgi:uncharacterized protein